MKEKSEQQRKSAISDIKHAAKNWDELLSEQILKSLLGPSSAELTSGPWTLNQILTDMLKWAIIEDNFEMMEFVLASSNASFIEYMTDKDFGKGTSIVNIAMRHVKDKRILRRLANVFPELLNKVDESGNTPIYICVYKQNMPAIEVLCDELRDSIDIDKPSSNGRNPLICASGNADFDLMSYLLEHRANPYVKDRHDMDIIYHLAMQISENNTDNVDPGNFYTYIKEKCPLIPDGLLNDPTHWIFVNRCFDDE